ncbi:MAG: iron ABC transporter permease, partial [Candidatus Eremiobacteraeota bacterium]|nr:iron ABC transporter permease [Candidatus Eremiobacteraeota bacterium]
MAAIAPGAPRAVSRKALWLFALAACALLAAAVSVAVGSVALEPRSLFDALWHPGAQSLAHTLMWDIRLPRIALAACVGAGLGVAGAMLQVLFRNPLVDPYVTGVSAGAAVTASAGIALGLSFAFVPIAAFGGGLACALIVTLVSAGESGGANLRLVLCGVAISSLCAALVTIVLLRAGMSDSITILGWLAGGIGGRSWSDVALTATYIATGFAAAMFLLRALNVLRLGTDAAAGFGLHVARARFVVLAAAALLAAACVAVSGIVGFVGLMVPHAARRMVGGDAAWLLPASAFGGAIVVLAADAVARAIAAPAELPLGVLLAFVG